MSKDLSAPLLRTARLLDLVPYLNSNQGISVNDLAKDFGVSVAQINSDLTTLWMCGLPGYTPLELMDLEFESGYVTIRNAKTLSKPRDVSFDEGLALVLGLELLQQQIPQDRKDLQTAIDVLKDRLSMQIGVPRAVTVSHGINPEIVSPLVAAIKTARDVDITYHSLYTDEISERTISPQAIYVEDGNSYLRAYYKNAKASRIFRIDRILSLSLPKLDKESASTLENSIDTTDAKIVKISYTIRIKRLTRDVIEQFNLGPRLHEISQSDEITVQLSSFSSEWIQRAVFATGPNVELLSPLELRKEIANRALLLTDQYAQK